MKSELPLEPQEEKTYNIKIKKVTWDVEMKHKKSLFLMEFHFNIQSIVNISSQDTFALVESIRIPGDSCWASPACKWLETVHS